MKLCLEAAGCTFADVFKVNGYLADLADIDVYNAVFKTVLRAALSGAHDGRRSADRRARRWSRSTALARRPAS